MVLLSRAIPSSLLLILLLLPSVSSFAPIRIVYPTTIATSSATATVTSIATSRTNQNTCIAMSTTDSSAPETGSADTASLPEPASMRIKEIKNELDAMDIQYKDCFDKESLCQRLVDARNGSISAPPKKAPEPEPVAAPTPAPAAKTSTNSSFDKEAKSQELRSKRVRELRTMCAQFNIRWATMIEKEELVQALVAHYEMASHFSPSGKIVPGQVASIDETVLEQELTSEGGTVAPLLLDVYATWCGPCKMMAPELVLAAEELGDSVRVAKMDSDENPNYSAKLNIKGLPSVIVFDGLTGKELQRVEGALMKDDLIKLARSHLN